MTEIDKQKTSPSTFNKKVTHPSLQGWVKPLYHAGCFTFFLFVHFFWASFLDHPQKTRDGSIDVLWMLRSMTWCWEMNMKKNGLQWRRGSRWWSWFLSWGGVLTSCWSKKAPTVGPIEPFLNGPHEKTWVSSSSSLATCLRGPPLVRSCPTFWWMLIFEKRNPVVKKTWKPVELEIVFFSSFRKVYIPLFLNLKKMGFIHPFSGLPISKFKAGVWYPT